MSSLKQAAYSSSADLIGGNEELLRNILIYVRDKSLCRSKAVCKLWLSIISDHDFTLAWRTKHIPSLSALILDGSCFAQRSELVPLDEPTHDLPSPNFDFNDSLRILQSSNGLLLLSSESRHDKEFVVYNPTTIQSKLLPKLGKQYICDDYHAVLAFEPLKSPHFKVILCAQSLSAETRRYHMTDIYIYDSEIDSWRIPFIHNSPYSSYGVYWNGAIHWWLTNLYLVIGRPRFRKMPMYPIPSPDDFAYFRESGGNLLLFYSQEEKLPLQLQVFQMELDYSKWFVKYNVDLTPLSFQFRELGMFNPRFCFLALVTPLLVMYVPGSKFEKDEYSSDAKFQDDVVVSYNLQTETSKNLGQFPTQSMIHFRRWLPFSRLLLTLR